ncbi:MAG: amidase family protein [Acidobacteriota bacterium]
MSTSADRVLSATEIAAAVAARRVSAAEVAQATLARLEQRNAALNAVVTINPRLLDEAAAIDARLARGEMVGALAGVPVGIKDITPVAGLRTTYGSPIFADHVPEADAEVVARLRQAGAIIVGKTNTPEFAAGANTWNDVFGRTRNPWNLELSAGGSTGGGAAALAAGLIALAEGTDLGGSLRIPAAFCGVVGLRPSPGLVPTHPVDWVWDTLSVSGPMARSVADVALMLQVMAGRSPSAPLGQPTARRDFVAAARGGVPSGFRVGYCADIAAIGMDASIADTCHQAAMGLTAPALHVAEIALDLSEFRDAFLTLRAEWFVASMADKLDDRDRFGVNVRANTDAGLALDGRMLGAAHQARGRLWHRMRDLFTRVDCLLTPTVAVAPFPVTQNYPDEVAGKKMRTYVDWFAPTFLLSLTGLPVASVPCGLDTRGLPVGLQVVGRPNDEESVLALAAEIHRRHPIALPL